MMMMMKGRRFLWHLCNIAVSDIVFAEACCIDITCGTDCICYLYWESRVTWCSVCVISHQQFHCLVVISFTGHPVLESARSFIGFRSSQHHQQEVPGYLPSDNQHTPLIVLSRAYLKLPALAHLVWPSCSPSHSFLPSYSPVFFLERASDSVIAHISLQAKCKS